MARHRRTLPGLKALIGHPPIRSFAAADFHGLHAYYLVDGAGRRQAFRYHWMSTMAEERTVSQAQAALWPPQFLVEEMRSGWREDRCGGAGARARPGWRSPPTIKLLAWPASRARIHAGTLTLTAGHPDQDVVDGMVFDPTNVPTGIECSDDPLLAFRSAVYGASHAARTRECKPIADLVDVDRER